MEAFYGCYLLSSCKPGSLHRTYVGFTVDPRRRIRQHNGEIAAGAWKTKRWRPWKMVLCVWGFPHKVVALQFEHAWQHPGISRHVRAQASRFSFVKTWRRGNFIRQREVMGVQKNLQVVLTMLALPPYCRMPLRLHFLDRQTKELLPTTPAFHFLPLHMVVSQGSFDDLETAVAESLRSAQTHPNALGNRPSCRGCKDLLQSGDRLVKCPGCSACFHVRCAMRVFPSWNSQNLLPEGTTNCPGCGHRWDWPTLVMNGSRFREARSGPANCAHADPTKRLGRVPQQQKQQRQKRQRQPRKQQQQQQKQKQQRQPQPHQPRQPQQQLRSTAARMSVESSDEEPLLSHLSRTVRGRGPPPRRGKATMGKPRGFSLKPRLSAKQASLLARRSSRKLGRLATTTTAPGSAAGNAGASSWLSSSFPLLSSTLLATSGAFAASAEASQHSPTPPAPTPARKRQNKRRSLPRTAPAAFSEAPASRTAAASFCDLSSSSLLLSHLAPPSCAEQLVKTSLQDTPSASASTPTPPRKFEFERPRASWLLPVTIDLEEEEEPGVLEGNVRKVTEPLAKEDVSHAGSSPTCSSKPAESLRERLARKRGRIQIG
uniref:Structure-specific endonuclease subunit SLX1 homolog n=1 Tax=Crypthecodinium cohnii TaxID=2866 RepID=A0A516AGQ8_CRYCO|nr:structure-specific endonuclease subunit SLX1 [Crypthecodinium cohnii]USW07906.1 structure-specific endonuclease subunit SLX1 [Crypthecodinium cohnii]